MTAQASVQAGGTSALVERLDALGLAAARLRGYAAVPVGETEHWVGQARQRLRHGADHTIVALAGTTGSGKSSLLNAVAGAPIARAGVTRPTTATAQAVVVARERAQESARERAQESARERAQESARERAADDDGGVAAVLDWLEVPRRHHVAAADVGADLGGLVLLDLPDIDSVETSHHLEAARLIGVVDLLLFVTDPQKYADRTLHADHLEPLAGHAGSLAVLLNKVDTLTPPQAQACLDDLDRLLDDDGLPSVQPLPVSAATGEGMNALLGLLAGEVRARQAMVDRIEAGLVEHATLLWDVVAGPSRALDTASAVTPRLEEGLTRAVGVDALADLVAGRHRRAATLRTGWPPLRWRRRVRARAATAPLQPGRSAVARAAVAGTLRDVGDVVAEATPAAVRADARAIVEDATTSVVEALDRVTVRVADALDGRPRWWTAVGLLQTALLVVAGAGLAWLLGVTIAEATLRVDPEAFLVRVDGGLPVPTAMLVGGLLLGVVVGVLAGLAARVGAARRAHRVREQVGAAIAAVAEDEVLTPLAAFTSDLDTARTALTAARTP